MLASPAAIRLLEADGADRGARVAAHIAALAANGRRPVLVTWGTPYDKWRELLRAAGLEPDRVEILDASGGRAIGGPVFLPHVLLVESPVLLEKVGARLDLLCRRLGSEAHVVLDSVNLLALHNPPGAVEEFLHYLSNRMRVLNVGLDLVQFADRRGEDPVAGVRSFVDASMPC